MVGNNGANFRTEFNQLPRDDEGGLRAPPGLSGWRKAWWWFDFLILVKLARLRFIGILVVIGVIITQWDTLIAYYDKWTRPVDSSAAVAGDVEWFCPMHPSVVRDNGKDKCPICFMPLSKRKKGDVHEAALPPGVVNVVTASDHLVGEELTLSPKVDLISFTGSTAVGKRIMEKGAATMKRLFLELGGKSATIVLEDADFS